MRRALAILIAVVFAAGGFFAGRMSRAGTVEQCEQRAAQLEHERDQARSERGSQLASALALASRGLDQARRAPGAHAPPPTVPSEPRSGIEVSVGDAPDGGDPKNMLSMMLAAKDKAREALDKMQRATRLSSDQRATLDRGIQAMNLALGDAVERFAKYGQQKEPRSRELLPIAIDALTALKKADDDFRAGLDASQARALDDDGFDLMSQIDPLVFLRFMTPPDPPTAKR